jgi:hypothetical protein
MEFMHVQQHQAPQLNNSVLDDFNVPNRSRYRETVLVLILSYLQCMHV